MHQTKVQDATYETLAPREDDNLGCQLRDRLLQDIVATSMLVTGAREVLHKGGDPHEIDALFARAQHAAEGDADKLRAVIDELGSVA